MSAIRTPRPALRGALLRGLFVASGLALGGCGGAGGGEVPTATATRGDLRITLTVPGELKAVNSTTITAPDLGNNIKVTSIVAEGTRVEKGDVLVEFDQNDLLDRLQQDRSALDVALTKIEQQQAQFDVRLRDLESAVTRAELDLARAKMRVTDSATVPLVDREGARIDVQQAELALTQSRASLDSARLQSEAEVQLQQLEADQKRLSVKRAEQRLDQATIKAPASGLVILPEIWKGGSRGQVSAGDTLWSGTTIMELPDLSALEVEAWVHEVDAGQVAADQPVQVIIDAYPDPPWPGHISRVADLAVKRNRDALVKHVKITGTLDTLAEQMKPGMTVRVEIEVGREPNALSIPREAVFYEGEAPRVFRQGGLSGFERVPVTLGRQNDTHVVVTEGLAEGDVVALVDPDRFAAGEASTAGQPGESPATPAE